METEEPTWTDAGWTEHKHAPQKSPRSFAWQRAILSEQAALESATAIPEPFWVQRYIHMLFGVEPVAPTQFIDRTTGKQVVVHWASLILLDAECARPAIEDYVLLPRWADAVAV